MVHITQRHSISRQCCWWRSPPQTGTAGETGCTVQHKHTDRGSNDCQLVAGLLSGGSTPAGGLPGYTPSQPSWSGPVMNRRRHVTGVRGRSWQGWTGGSVAKWPSMPRPHFPAVQSKTTREVLPPYRSPDPDGIPWTSLHIRQPVFQRLLCEKILSENEQWLSK